MSFLPVKVHKIVPTKKVEKRFGRKGRTQNCDEVVSGVGVGGWKGDVETFSV
jgi:hypothetical protein